MKVKPFDDTAKALELLSRGYRKDLEKQWPKGFMRGDNLFLHEFRVKPDNQILVSDAGEAAPVHNMSGTISFRYPQVSVAVRHVDTAAAEDTCNWIFRNVQDLWLGSRDYSSFKYVEAAPYKMEDDKDGLCSWGFTLRLEVRP